jgi:putative lipoprotein
MKYLSILVSALILLNLSACSDPKEAKQEPTASASLSGEVFYRERKLLPPGAVLKVTLEDVSKMDVASTVIGESSQVLDGAPPYAFSLEYPSDVIDARMQYGLRATIHMQDQLIFTSTQHLDPFKTPAEPISIMLSSVKKSPMAASASPTPHGASTGLAVVSVNPLAELNNTYWKLTELNGNPVVMGEKQKKEAYLQLVSEGAKVRGFSGCNNFNGIYVVKGNLLEFGRIAQTKMMCMGGMETEQAMMTVLSATAYYSISEERLTLLNTEKKPVAKFQATYLN